MCALLFIGLHWSVQCIRPCLGRVLFQMRMPPRGRHQSSICHCECVSPNSIPGSIYLFIVYHIIMPALVHIMMVYIMHCWPSPIILLPTTAPDDHRMGQWWGGGGVMCHQNSYMTLIWPCITCTPCSYAHAISTHDIVHACAGDIIIITVLILMERMIQFNVRISFPRILITFIYGVIDDVYQKIACFQNRNYFFFFMRCIRLSTVYTCVTCNV